MGSKRLQCPRTKMIPKEVQVSSSFYQYCVPFFSFAGVFISLLFILFVTVHSKASVLVNFYWDNKGSDSDILSNLRCNAPRPDIMPSAAPGQTDGLLAC